MGAFDDAAAALHADQNLSRPATYFAGGTGLGVSLRVIFSQGGRKDGFGETGKVAQDLTAELLKADVAEPARADTLQIGAEGDTVDPGSPIYTIATVLPDAEGVANVCALRLNP